MNAETLQRDVNELIQFYDLYMPDKGGQQIRVYATPVELARALSLPYDPAQKGNEFSYRGRTLIAIGHRSERRDIRK